MELTVNDKECWICGKRFIENDKRMCKTDHHTLPKSLHPVKNVVVPIHKKCHDFVNMSDIRGMYAFAFKIDKMMGEIRSSSKEFFDLVSSKFKKHGGSK